MSSGKYSGSSRLSYNRSHMRLYCRWSGSAPNISSHATSSKPKRPSAAQPLTMSPMSMPR